jgi:hypothetical protein
MEPARLEPEALVYWWADGVYFNVRLDEERTCVLVLIGATEDGTKELLAVVDGYRESAASKNQENRQSSTAKNQTQRQQTTQSTTSKNQTQRQQTAQSTTGQNQTQRQNYGQNAQQNRQNFANNYGSAGSNGAWSGGGSPGNWAGFYAGAATVAGDGCNRPEPSSAINAHCSSG